MRPCPLIGAHGNGWTLRVVAWVNAKGGAPRLDEHRHGMRCAWPAGNAHPCRVDDSPTNDRCAAGWGAGCSGEARDACPGGRLQTNLGVNVARPRVSRTKPCRTRLRAARRSRRTIHIGIGLRFADNAFGFARDRWRRTTAPAILTGLRERIGCNAETQSRALGAAFMGWRARMRQNCSQSSASLEVVAGASLPDLGTTAEAAAAGATAGSDRGCAGIFKAGGAATRLRTARPVDVVAAAGLR